MTEFPQWRRFDEIASVALLSRNGAGNSRIPSIRDPRVKPEDDTKQPEDDTGLGILEFSSLRAKRSNL